MNNKKVLEKAEKLLDKTSWLWYHIKAVSQETFFDEKVSKLQNIN